jgi:hypothetical protein
MCRMLQVDLPRPLWRKAVVRVRRVQAPEPEPEPEPAPEPTVPAAASAAPAEERASPPRPRPTRLFRDDLDFWEPPTPYRPPKRD